MNLKMLSKMLYMIIPAIIMARYPFIQNFTATSLTYENGYLIVSGTLDVYFREQAWNDFGYKKGNFDWFNEWWQNQVGNRYGPFTLVSINWNLIEETETHDKLSFLIVLEPRAHIGTKTK